MSLDVRVKVYTTFRRLVRNSHQLLSMPFVSIGVYAEMEKYARDATMFAS